MPSLAVPPKRLQYGGQIYSWRLFLPILLGARFIWVTLLLFVQSRGVCIDLAPQNDVQMFHSPSTILATIVWVTRAIAIAPILAEIIFRGFIYRGLKGLQCKFVAASFMSFICALFHWNWSAFIGRFALGMCLTWIDEHGAYMLEPRLKPAMLNATTIVRILFDSNVTTVSSGNSLQNWQA
jgi:membrane protease YdiL (CAAX protease family)